MATNDVQNQQLSEWLQLLGCPVELSPEDLKKLNTPSMRSVWRHLQRHSKPVGIVRTIKKNLLLAKLNTENGLFPGKFGNFKIETVQDLIKLQKNLVTQKEIELLREKIRAVDESLLTANSSLTTKIFEKERMMHNLEELHEKLALLNLKLTCVQSDVENLDKELQIASILKTGPATQLSSLELKENMLLVANCVKRFSAVETTDDCIIEMIVSMSEFPPSVILNGTLSVSNHALKTLNTSKTAKIMIKPNHLNKRKKFSFSNQLTDLGSTVVKNEMELQSISRKMVACKAKLEEERAALYGLIEKAVTSGNSEGLKLIELVDKLLENTLEIKKEEKLQELIDKLQNVCPSDFDHANLMLNSNKKKEEERLLKEVNEKLTAINKLIDPINAMTVSFVKAGVLQRTKDLMSKSLTDLNRHKDEENQCQVLVSENLISKEIEMFQKLPLVVMARRWEDGYEAIPQSVREDILKALELFDFLCQSPKNLVKNIVEKTFWLHTNHR